MMNVQTDRYSLYEGDCLEVMPKLPAGSIDCICVDLPYGVTSCAWDSVIPLEPMWTQFKRVIKPHGAIVLFGSQPFTSHLIKSNLEWFRYCWVWNKGQISNPQLAKIQPLKCHEDICIFSSGSAAYNPQGLMPFFSKSQGKSSALGHCVRRDDYVQTVTNYPQSILNMSVERGLHPTQKPVDLLAYLIQTYTNPGETVLDCCIGSGTTIVAALETGRKAVGIEKDTTYFQIAAKRCADAHRAAQGKPKELRGTVADMADMPLFAGIGT